MLNAALKDCPVVVRQGEELSPDAAKVTAWRRRRGSWHVGIPRSRFGPIPGGTQRARSTSSVRFRHGRQLPRVTSASIASWLRKARRRAVLGLSQQNGDSKNSLPKAAKKVTAEYGYPYQKPRMHGADERHARLHPGKMRVWCARRTARRFAAAMDASGLPADKCQVYKIMLGGASAGAVTQRLCHPGGFYRQQMPARREAAVVARGDMHTAL